MAADVTRPTSQRRGHPGTCGDCYTWTGARGSAHDPWRCPFLRDAILRLEREIQEKQERLARLNITLFAAISEQEPR